MKDWRQRETMIWQLASFGEKERLLDMGLTDRKLYINLVRELFRKYAI